MTPDELQSRASDERRWQETSALVDAVLELPVAERSLFLARAHLTDEVREEVDGLLRACERSEGFLHGAASAFAAPLLEGSASPHAQDEAAALARLRGALAGRYTIERELGRGGMAMVYLARDVSREREVAVKLLRPELAVSLGAGRFLREIETAARLAHANILPVLDSGEADGLLYYVLPYVEGETLRERLDRERRLPVDDAVCIATTIAGALGYVHTHGVLHRDLKPENVLLANGQAFIADFGIACAITRAAGRECPDPRSSPLTATGISLGTPGYMSPEQAVGSRTVDGRSDIYALGCLLFEMLAGQPPFTGPTADNVIRQHVNAPAPELAAVRKDIDRGVAKAVARALSKSPEDRFVTMRAFAQALSASGSRESWVRRLLSRLPN